MASKDKGKKIAGTGSSAGGKRKHSDGKSGGDSRKRKNPGVLQFFEHSAAEADASDDSDLDGRYPISDVYFGYAFCSGFQFQGFWKWICLKLASFVNGPPFSLINLVHFLLLLLSFFPFFSFSFSFC